MGDETIVSQRPLIVGVGASAGGLEALEGLFGATPPDTGAAFVVVQHLSPDFESMMDQLLERRTALAVTRVRDGMRVEPDTIHLIPPRHDMIISDGRLLLSDKGEERELSLPIDIFFRSLAREEGERGVGVILSGTGTDGSRGVQAISEAGGLVLAQSPQEAVFDGMPKAARDTGCVDLVLPVADISRAIQRYRARLDAGQSARHAESDPMAKIIATLREANDLDFEQYKVTTVARRIERRVLLHQDADLASYARRLEQDPDEVDALYRDLLIGVTQFFRDREAFDILGREVVPEIIARAREHGRELRAWVAGCATGEEAYSLAMLIRERLETDGAELPVKIFATDAHERSIAHAGEGLYDGHALEDLSVERRERWFSREGERWRVARELRQMVVFARHDVVNDAPFTRLDFLSCRNLLIYLKSAAQRKVISLFHFGLRPSGVLFLGTSESLGAVADEFGEIDPRWRLFRKLRDSRLADAAAFRRGPGLSRAAPQTSPVRSVKRLLASYDSLLERYMPPSLLVSPDREVLHVFGGASRFLQVREGRPSSDLLDVLAAELKLPLAGALQRVRKVREPIVFTGVEVAGERLELRVEPVTSGDGPPDILIALEPTGESVAEPAAESGPSLNVHELTQQQLGDLERELEHTKENLQATIEELESSNEEMQATNEELVASNEELQSTNEELQSVNEELYTVNAELQKKIDELSRLTNDMDNLLSATDIGTIFVDAELRIRRFTPRITELFKLVPADVGRPLDTFTHSIEHEDLMAEARAVLRGGPPHEREVRGASSRWYFLRIHPYETADGIEGVVLTLVDLTALKRAERELYRARHLLDSLMDTLPDDVYFADAEGRFVRINRAFARRLGLDGPADARGKRPSEVMSPALGARWEATDAGIRERGRPIINALERRESDREWALITKLALRDEDGEVVGTFGVSRDVTSQKRAEEEAREAVRRRDAFLAILSHELRNPLGGIMNASLVLDGEDEPVDVIRRQANHMARLLDDLLDVSRVTQDKIELQRERLDLREVVTGASETLRKRADDARVQLHLALPDAPLHVDGDRTRLRQVVTNLVTNALKYNEPGGNVWITAATEGATVTLRVRDDGLGMEPQMLERIFDMFVQGDGSLERSDGGMGLGLALVERLVIGHGGAVHARSDGPGSGSELVVQLPRAQEGSARVDTRAPSEEASSATPSGPVVLVEDQADNREMLRLILEQRGVEVLEAGDGEEGVALILRTTPAAAVVDIGLPRIDGFEVARRVRAELGDAVRLIALTGYGMREDRERALAAGFDSHLVKPVDVADLEAALGG